eukprot:2373150-Pleurochrysis_carterae.AAC.1
MRSWTGGAPGRGRKFAASFALCPPNTCTEGSFTDRTVLLECPFEDCAIGLTRGRKASRPSSN